MQNPKLKFVSFLSAVLILSFAALYFIFAWQEPSSNPPGGNVPAPINVGTDAQAKAGRISATEFYDYNDSNYYLNPNGTSNINKLTVGTVDPEYIIEGKKYATYVSDFAGGVRVETSGIVTVGPERKCVIDFANLEKGSDLWLFWQTSNKNIDDLAVLLTPNFQGSVWYKKSGSKLIIYGKGEGEVSYRLTLPRKDYENWGNLIGE